MQVFRFEPVAERLNDRRWEASTIKEAFWITGESEDHARHQASMILMKMVDMKPGESIVYSPWLDSEFAECVPDNPPVDVPDGIIVTVGGQTHS